MRWRFSVRICRLSLSLAINHAFGINSRDEAAIFAITKLTDISCILLSLLAWKISRQKIILIRENKRHMSSFSTRLTNSNFFICPQNDEITCSYLCFSLTCEIFVKNLLLSVSLSNLEFSFQAKFSKYFSNIWNYSVLILKFSKWAWTSNSSRFSDSLNVSKYMTLVINRLWDFVDL